MYPAVPDQTALNIAGLLERLETVVWWTGFWQGSVTTAVVILVFALFIHMIRKEGG